eukprot:TRINITY_DN167_c0_g1_i2.p1 TRINITY_DN167_c0_g1~~TRINITY_DN167_c0_g1_i2.p1  ORF type:complete len:369 (+),score=98.45 TRINITY_DN167_c0_g1_i2:134-1240(+)
MEGNEVKCEVTGKPIVAFSVDENFGEHRFLCSDCVSSLEPEKKDALIQVSDFEKDPKILEKALNTEAQSQLHELLLLDVGGNEELFRALDQKVEDLTQELVETLEFECNNKCTEMREQIVKQQSRLAMLKSKPTLSVEKYLQLYRTDPKRFTEAIDKLSKPTERASLEPMIREYKQAHTNINYSIHPATLEAVKKRAIEELNKTLNLFTNSRVIWNTGDTVVNFTEKCWKNITTKELIPPFEARVRVTGVTEQKSAEIGLLGEEITTPQTKISGYERFYLNLLTKVVKYTAPNEQQGTVLREGIELLKNSEIYIKVDRERNATISVDRTSFVQQKLSPEMKIHLHFGSCTPAAKAEILDITTESQLGQ